MASSRHYQRLAEVPDQLATRSELRSWGLRPNGPPVASVTVIAAISGAARLEKLYPVAEAVAAEPGQAAARSSAAAGRSAGP